jgi:predicted esterase
MTPVIGLFTLAAAVQLNLACPGFQKSGPSKKWEADDVPQPEECIVGGNEKMHYLLHAPGQDAKEPGDGWHVLVVLPGGDGSADFAPFVGRIRQHALSDDWVVVQLVAPVWDDKQLDRLVWPTEKNAYKGMKFSTEHLCASVLEDVGKKRRVDSKYVYTLSWSSGGPAAYSIALSPNTQVTGSLVAMSVFKKSDLPTLKNGAGRRFYILHSPQDQVCPIKMAEQARDELTKAGAVVEFSTYEGGHGWRGNVYGNVKSGIEWLASGSKPAQGAKSKK